MKKILLSLNVLAVLMSCNKTAIRNDYPIHPVPFTDVQFTDDFWKPRLDTNRIVTIPYDFKKSEETSRINNFAVAGGVVDDEFKGIRYNDSDVFKIMEGAAYSLSTDPDPELERYMDSLISLIAAAQEPDGYLYTARTASPDSVIPYSGESRWSQLKDSHELYNIGHMYEAAVAYYQATGKRNFLDVALKSADLVCETFGPEDDKLHGVPGHQEIEIGLVKLYRVSGEKRYLDMAKYFLDQRGNAKGHELYVYGKDGSNKVYTQDHLPVTEQCDAVGHAVRAAYMYSGMTDIAALTGDQDYKNAVRKLWEDVVYKKTYITGGIGSKHSGEAFGEAYYLPNLSAYNETCAAIANMLWNERMFLLNGNSDYIDVLERTLYNGFLSGVSIHGDEFFYPNPLESDGSHKRSAWFNCSCCPTNVARFLPSLPGYVYARAGDKIYVNLFIGNQASIKTEFGTIEINMKTNYPWDGKVQMEINPESAKEFSVMLRIPGWAQNNPLPGELYRFINSSTEKPVVKINGENVDFKMNDGYAMLNRIWEKGDIIDLSLPMEVRKIKASEKVKENHGKLAVSRGPVIYCAEWIDNNNKVRNLLVDENIKLSREFKPELIDGIEILKGEAEKVSLNKKDHLMKTKEKLTLIPYYAWAHRGPGEMVVWMAYEDSVANPVLPPTIASESKPSASYVHDQIFAINDQLIPKNSNDHSIPRLTFWSHKGTEEWVQYDFKKKTPIAYLHVYWFDDGPNGGCRIPKSWKAMYLNNGKWIEVRKHGEYPVSKDEFNTIEIAPIETTAIRLVIQLQDVYSGGILEWKVE